MKATLAMNPHMKPPFLLILLLCLGTSMRADVVISTFEDLNNNGRRDSGEPLITGLTVTAVDNMSRSLPLLDDGAGTHTLPGLVFQGRVRIQITGYDLDHRQGKNRPTTVLFAEDGDSFDIPVLTDQPVDLQTANIIIPCYEKGSAETKDAAPALVHFPFAAEGVSEKFGGDGPNPTQDATISQLGSTWGMAYQRTFRRAFAAALVKRHVGMGPAGEDGIYSIDYSTTPPSINHFNLEGINPAVGPSIELGKVRREIVDVPINETMPYALSTVLLRNRRASYDIDAFDKVGKTSFGDIEMANDGRSLWMVNTYQRSLIKLDVGRKDIDPEAEDLEHYLLEDLPGIPNLNFRFRMCVNAGGNLNQGGAEAFTDKNKVAWDKNRYSNGGNDGYLVPLGDGPEADWNGNYRVPLWDGPDAEWIMASSLG